MTFGNQGIRTRTGSTGRGFASMDPERQREIVAEDFRRGGLRNAAAQPRILQTDWMRVQPGREASLHEGGSGRRDR